MENYDVVVIGAGLSGLRSARLLAETGLSVLLADRKEDITQAIHTTGIFVRRTLESFDLPQACLGPPIRQVSLYSPSLRVLTLVSRHDEFRIGHMEALYEEELHQARSAGVDWAPGHALVETDFLRHDIVVELRDRLGTPRLVRTRFLVGADGVFSTVAQKLRLSRNRVWIAGTEFVYRGVPTLGTPRLLCFLDPRIAPGYIAWMAFDGSEVHLGAGGYPARFHAGYALSALRGRLAEMVDRHELPADVYAVAGATPTEVRAGAIPVGGILERLACTRGLLVGDAAGAPSPLTGGGLDPCLRLSAVAAEAIADHLLRADPAGLQAYVGGRFRPPFASRLLMRRIFAAVDDPRLLELLCRGMRLRPLRALAEQVFYGAGSFPDVAPERPATEPLPQGR